MEIWYNCWRKPICCCETLWFVCFIFSFSRSKQGMIILSFSQQGILSYFSTKWWHRLSFLIGERNYFCYQLLAIFLFSCLHKLILSLLAIISSLFEISGATSYSDSIVAVGSSSSGDWKIILLFWQDIDVSLNWSPFTLFRLWKISISFWQLWFTIHGIWWVEIAKYQICMEPEIYPIN